MGIGAGRPKEELLYKSNRVPSNVGKTPYVVACFIVLIFLAIFSYTLYSVIKKYGSLL